jgi:hypothetical protein
MMEMRVMMVMNLNGGILHRFLYCSHIAKIFASESPKNFSATNDTNYTNDF